MNINSYQTTAKFYCTLPGKAFFDSCNASYLKQDGQNDNGYAIFRLTADAQSLKKAG